MVNGTNAHRATALPSQPPSQHHHLELNMKPFHLRSLPLVAAFGTAVIAVTAAAWTGTSTSVLAGASENADAALTRQSVFLILDEDAIDNGSPPNYFSANAVNDPIADLARRTELRFFDRKPGEIIRLHSGTVGDEGWFAVKEIPGSWTAAGPTANGLQNYMGDNRLPYPHQVGPGLGTGPNPEVLLDNVPLITPLRATGLDMLVGQVVSAVVYDGDLSINYGPLMGNIQGATIGTVSFKVLEVKELTTWSTGSLPEVTIQILDANRVCQARHQRLFLNAPEPSSSSEPFDVRP